MSGFFEATIPMWPVVIGFGILAISGFAMKAASRAIRMQQEHITLLESDRFAGADSLGRPPFWEN